MGVELTGNRGSGSVDIAVRMCRGLGIHQRAQIGMGDVAGWIMESYKPAGRGTSGVFKQDLLF